MWQLDGIAETGCRDYLERPREHRSRSCANNQNKFIHQHTYPRLQGRGRSQVEWVRDRKWGLSKTWQKRIHLKRQVCQSREREKEEHLRSPMNEPCIWKKSHGINQHTSELAGAHSKQFNSASSLHGWGNQDPKNMKDLPGFSSKLMVEPCLESRTPASKSHSLPPPIFCLASVWLHLARKKRTIATGTTGRCLES